MRPYPTDAFRNSETAFEALCDSLGAPEADAMDHAALEALLEDQGTKLLRTLMQDHLDLRRVRESGRAGERESGEPVRGADGEVRTERRESTRRRRGRSRRGQRVQRDHRRRNAAGQRPRGHHRSRAPRPLIPFGPSHPPPPAHATRVPQARAPGLGDASSLARAAADVLAAAWRGLPCLPASAGTSRPPDACSRIEPIWHTSPSSSGARDGRTPDTATPPDRTTHT